VATNYLAQGAGEPLADFDKHHVFVLKMKMTNAKVATLNAIPTPRCLPRQRQERTKVMREHAAMMTNKSANIAARFVKY
jgi:hypothetical protein